ncbi:MAG: hypothetical protein ABWK00_02525 [Desulfurococcaceae archaeon]
MAILVTTSREPSQRTRSFARDLASILPRAFYVVRGKRSLNDLALAAFLGTADRAVVVNERRGNPSLITVYAASALRGRPSLERRAALKLRGVKLAREVPGGIGRGTGVSRAFVEVACNSELCRGVAEVIMDVIGQKLLVGRERADVVLVLEDKRDFVTLYAVNRNGLRVGPEAKIERVIVHDLRS